MKAILRSSCLCLFYLVQTFMKSLLYVTQYSRSFGVCRWVNPSQSKSIPLWLVISISVYVSYFCRKCVLFWIVCLLLPKLGPAHPHPQGSLCLFSPTSTLPIPTKPPFRRFPSILTSWFTGLPQMPLLSIHSSHWLLSKSTVLWLQVPLHSLLPTQLSGVTVGDTEHC